MTLPKVWLLTFWINNEGHLVQGIFSTEQKAGDYLEANGVPFGYDGYEISDWIVDDPDEKTTGH